MTKKIYRTAQGKTVDMGALQLQNEQIRAVGNMNVNARGDLLDSNNQIIDQKNRQAQRNYARQSTTSKARPQTGTIQAKKVQEVVEQAIDDDVLGPMDQVDSVELKTINDTVVEDTPRGGLAAAIARTREVKQELEKIPEQTKTLRKI
jgi:hypothetical protein